MRNIRKSQKLILFATLGIILLCFIPAAVASEGRVTERPLEDWLETNWDFFSWGVQNNWAFSDFVSPYNYLVCKMGFPWPLAGFGPFINDMILENSLVVGDTVITGHITELELNDGQALISLHLDVKNAPLTVYDYFEFIYYCLGKSGEPQAILGTEEDGYIDYKVVCKFIIPEPGAEFPNVWSLWDNYISCNIIGTGYGTLTEHAVEHGFAGTAGTLGMVKLHQIALFKPDLNENHPKYDPVYGDLWPVETVEIYEIR